MLSALEISICLIPIAPFVAAVLAPLIQRYCADMTGWVLAIVPLSIFVFLCSFIPQIVEQGPAGFEYAGFDWVASYGLRFSFFIDGLNLTFGLLISGIGTFIVLYSGAYLSGHRHQGRFFAFILMFMGSMLGLVFSDNMITLFVFWELTSITSFLLIGFDHVREASRRAAIQALVITGGGGLALLAGLIMLQQLTGQWEISALFQYAGAVGEQELYLPILILFLCGAFTKSAQFPFHFWLPNAMEAPTPVSAFLHSATMVTAGVFLLARFNPILGGTVAWGVILPIVGGVTLLWGATMALKQTDLKQMLAQTTVASLGLMVMLLGFSNEIAVTAVVLYLVAHACYKGALFMVAGSVDHATGTREITALGGLGKVMPFTFAAALIGVAGMAGAPLTLAFFAKEEMYAALMMDGFGSLLTQWQNLLAIVTLLIGNALMMGVGLAIAVKVFFGPLKPTPVKPHESSFSLWIGALCLGGLAIFTGVAVDWTGHYLITPAASPIHNFLVESHLVLDWTILTKPQFWVSVLTWALGVAVFWFIDDLRTRLRQAGRALGWSFDALFDAMMFGLIRMADWATRFWHHGRLEIYLVVVFACFALTLLVPLVLSGGLPAMPELTGLPFYEWSILLIAAVGLVAVVVARTRLVAIVSLGVQGFAVALIFLLFGAPDLSFTQFMVETLSVVILALVMTRLHLDQRDNRIVQDIFRDGGLAVICGVGVTMLMLTVLQTPLDMRLSDLFTATSVPLAHGHNIVNVILVDYRGLDTLGEISVVMTAGIAILALIRIRGGGPQTGAGAKKPETAKPRTEDAS